MKNGFRFYLCLMLMALNTPVLLAQQATDALIITPQGNVNVVSGKVQEGGNDLLPKGSIILWYGTATNVPKGWVICDGKNDTPDLSGRFVVGAGGQYKERSSGGEASLKLEEKNLPPHTHEINLVTEEAGKHNHEIPNVFYSTSTTSGGKAVSMYHTYNDDELSKGLKWIESLDAGNHKHTIKGSTSEVGKGQAFDNRPPFYALCYIMKL